jgi:GTP:adenosylcobinamide-phosphate guanylyltransferase
MTQKKTLGDRCGAVVIEDTLVNVDTNEDFDRLERILAGERGQ